MRRKVAFIPFSTILVFVLFVLSDASMIMRAAAQDATVPGSVSGTVVDASGKPIAHAALALTDAAGGQVAKAESDAAGKYGFSGVNEGEYNVTVSAAGFAVKTVHVIVTASQGLLDVSLAAQSPANPAPSLNDLGFSTQQIESDPKLQAMLHRRTEMLRTHQRLGLITTIPMVATLFTGGGAKVEREGGQTTRGLNDANLDLHLALGAATGALYGTTAYFAIRAPHVPGTHKHGAIRLHEALAFVHGPGMLATGVLGYMAYKQENSGEKVHGIASAHGPVAVVTTIAYGASMVAVSWPIRVKFWEKKQ